jgi:selenide,water dikinase
MATADDVGAVRLPGGDEALVATVDFITPICDDPGEFGAIAAANSLSDVHAMGARPLLALSITCFPAARRPLVELAAILQGGAETLGEAGVPVVGGHSVEDDEMKFGYAVVGLAHAERLWRNSTARPGDQLLLTKALGTGLLAAAARARKADEAHWRAAVEQMKATNAAAAQALASGPVHAATDVTGFGLAGHAAEMARGSGVTLRLAASELPVLEGALDAARRGLLTRARDTNLEYVGGDLHLTPGVDPLLLEIVLDAQTSGGLLLAVPDAGQAAKRLTAAGCAAVHVGRVEERGAHAVVIE